MSTQLSPEEFVRAAWSLVHRCDGSYRHYANGTILLQLSNHVFEDFPNYNDAYNFTLDRIEEVRKLREEIAWMTHNGDGPWDIATPKRILAVLTAQLTTLCTGLREEWTK
jgi:hypothetical protein